VAPSDHRGQPAWAADPPPIGQPTDHFRDRHPVGQQGLLSLSAIAAGDNLRLDRLGVSRRPPCQDAPETNSCKWGLDNTNQVFAGQAFDDDRGVENAFAEADLDAIPASNPLRGSLEPGVAFAGTGPIASGCTGNDFCAAWRRPTYDANHSFTGFEPALGVQLNTDPPDGSEVDLVSGTFDPAAGPSLAVAYVDANDDRLKVANVIAQRDANGRVTGLQLAGSALDLGGVYTDPDSNLGPAAPSLEVGDFSGDGTTQLAVSWSPAESTPAAPRVAAAILSGTPGGGLAVENGPITSTAPAAATEQLGPDAVVVGDVQGKPIDRLFVAPGLKGGFGDDLLRFSPGAGGSLSASAIPSALAPDEQHSDLKSVGDVNGDGVDEVVSTLDRRLNDAGPNIEILSPGTSSYTFRSGLEFGEEGSLGVGDGTRIPLPVFETTVLDARPTVDQRIAPRVGSKDWGAMPQIAVTFPQLGTDSLANNLGQTRVAVNLLSLDDTGTVDTTGAAKALTSFAFNANVAPPKLAPFALDGQAELGDPVQGQYTQLEPSVVLNSPPTHFDILDGQAYDPNFCYQGNQYMVPPVCFFNTEYEREQDASTEVKSETTEDWSVSAKLTTSFSILSLVDVDAEIRGGYGEKFSKDNTTTTSSNVDVTVKSLNSDKIYAITRTYDTLEYPLYQPGSENPSGYVLAVTPHTVSKRWIDSSSPAAADLRTNHQPGNILSYPENVTKAENPFISTTGGLDSFAHDEFELSDSSDYKYALTQKRMLDDGSSTEKNWNVGATVGIGGKIAGIFDTKLEVSGDYKNQNIETTKTSVGSTTKLTATMAGIDESFGETAYAVKPFAYWAPSSALVVDYAVEPVVAPPGAPKTWWQQEYGSKPDITLNLPRLLDYEEQAGISSDSARFISPDVNVLQGTCASPGPLLDRYPVPGAPLCVQAEVENYSLKDQASPTKVRFYDADPDVGGHLIGEADAGPITARDSRVVQIDWTPDARYAGTRPRIFAVVDADDQVSEVHETNNKGFRDFQARADAAIAPRAPSDVTAEPGPGRSLDVQWTDGLDEVQPAGHEWRVAVYPDEGGAPIVQTVPGGQGSVTLSDLPTGRYRAAVFSISGGVSSPASHPSEPADVVTDEPSAPRNVVGVARNAAVQLSWDPPDDTGGGPVETYRIREYRAPGVTFPEAPIETTVAGDVTALTLSGLTNGRPYRFTVQAVNGTGAGAVSGPSDPVTPLDVPDKPRDVDAAAGTAGTAHVEWDAPTADSKRAAVTGYEIVASPGGAVKTVAAGTTTVDFDGLDAGTAYTFRVRANSEVGFGAESEPSAPVTPADPPSEPRNLSAGPGAVPGSAALDWDEPDRDGGAPIESYEACLVGGSCQRVPATRTDASFPGVDTSVPLTFEVTARNEAGLDSPAARTTTPVILDEVPTVKLIKAPAENSFTGPDVVISFDATPSAADTECVVDGAPRPCRSPLRLSGLRDGSHTIQVEASSTGGTVKTEMVAWNVDSVAPQAKSRKLRKLVRKGKPSFQYRGSDRGGSDLAGYEVKVRRAGRRGKFKTDPVATDPSGKLESASGLKIRAGETVCASVRAVDGAGNRSARSKERCATRPFDEMALRKEGKWKKVRGKRYSKRHALQAKQPGSALNFLLGRTSKVKVLADRCTACGKVAIEVRGHRHKVIDLSKTKKRRSRVTVFNAKWPKRKDGRLRLIALGGGKVRIDGVAVWRTSR
jgi:hypothetical protein